MAAESQATFQRKARVSNDPDAPIEGRESFVEIRARRLREKQRQAEQAEAHGES